METRLTFHSRPIVQKHQCLTLFQTRLAYSRAWHYVDAGSDPRSLGRLASSIALVLMGKHKPIYDPSTDCGDYVVVAGCHDLRTTGKKRFQKKYYTHNTRPGSLRSMTMDQMFAKWGGGEVLRRAVKGMLPKNRLQEPRLARLKSELADVILSGAACQAFCGSLAGNGCVLMDWRLTFCYSFRGPRPSLQGEYRQVRKPVSSGQIARSARSFQRGQAIRMNI